jgi:hypothetical protein
MKGIVFTEFFEMVEQTYGYEMINTLIETTELESGGVYTSVGTYDHSEIVNLVVNLSKQTNTDIEVLLHAFGRYIFDTFLKSYPVFFENASNSFEFLSSIDNYIHVEVLKLYPDATLPRFSTEVIDGKMIMIYKSERSMSALAMGLIEKTLEHYGEELSITRDLVNDDGSEVKFVIG